MARGRDAFEFQPTLGDNIRIRRDDDKAALPQGKWWVGTYEKYQGKPGQRAGSKQGDKPQGGLMSTSFLITQPYLSFLIGGYGAKNTGVQLVVDGARINTETPGNGEVMRRVYWDVTQYLNKQAMVYIFDHNADAYGHVNADDFRFAESMPDTLLFPNSDFELGDLSNWNPEGEAMAFQPTKGDNVRVRAAKKTAAPQGDFWIGTFEKYQGKEGQKPGDSLGDKAEGSLSSIPFTVKGCAIQFLVGGGKGSSTAVRLLVDGMEERTASGHDHEGMQTMVWDTTEFLGQLAQIEIVDHADKGWAHVNADDFRYARFER